jgi:hypothetical protein
VLVLVFVCVRVSVRVRVFPGDSPNSGESVSVRVSVRVRVFPVIRLTQTWSMDLEE